MNSSILRDPLVIVTYAKPGIYKINFINNLNQLPLGASIYFNDFVN